jgi:carbon-monoxide dehydrogenase large subunit
MNAPISDREKALMGMGESRLRKEDARFIQGKGNYVDDIKLPGMLHMAIVRVSTRKKRSRFRVWSRC